MPEFTQAHTPGWLEYFSRRGSPDVAPLAAGVEGAIYDLGDGTVAKVWRQRRETELALMQRIYADIAAVGLPVATPEILAIEQVGASAVTIERKLPGQPLRTRLGPDDRGLDPAAARCVTAVLRSLASVPGTASMRQLPFLGEDQPLWTDATSFGAALAGLLRRRVERFGPIIRQRLPDFDIRFACLLERLAALDKVPDTVIHGDLVTSNILVDADLRPLAILDFGFFTTAGDPRLDAAVAAAIMNMYGPHARAVTTELTARLAADLGYAVDVLLTYQAAYAVATSNAFTLDGSDGHFAWCIAQLQRPDIDAALRLATVTTAPIPP
jgi:aminoglycoside phosphotransferase (APT) family kinase protein